MVALCLRRVGLTALDRCNCKHLLEAEVRLRVGFLRIRYGFFTALLVQEILPRDGLVKPRLRKLHCTSYQSGTRTTTVTQRTLPQPRKIETGILSESTHVIDDNPASSTDLAKGISKGRREGSTSDVNGHNATRRGRGGAVGRGRPNSRTPTRLHTKKYQIRTSTDVGIENLCHRRTLCEHTPPRTQRLELSWEKTGGY